MNVAKSIKKNFLFSVLYQAVTISLGLLVSRFVLLDYGSEVNGLLASVSQLLVYLSLFESGIQQVALRALYKPVYEKDHKEMNAILSAVNIHYKKVVRLYFGGLLLISLLYPMFTKLDTIGYWGVVPIVFFSGMGNVVVFHTQGKYRVLLQASGKNYVIIKVQTVITVLNNMLKIVFLLLQLPVIAIVLVNFGISSLQSLFICAYTRKHYRWINLEETPNQKALEQKNAMFVHQIAGLIFANTDMLILTATCGLRMVSVYAVYKLVMNYISSILLTVYNTFSFYLGQLFQVDRVRFTKLADTVEAYYSAAVLPIFTVALCLILPFIDLYTAGVEDVKYADPWLALLFVGVEVLTFIRIPMLNTISYAGMFRETLPQTILESIINIVVSLIGVHICGIYGVLIGTAAALLYRTADVFFYANRRLLGRGPWKTMSIYLVDLASMVLVVGLYQMFGSEVDSWLAFLRAGIIWTPIAFACNFALISLTFPKEAVYAGKIIRKMIG